MEGMHERLPYRISNRKEELQLVAVQGLLKTSCQASHRSKERSRKSVEGFLSWALYSGERQAGFLRAVTDGATYGWVRRDRRSGASG
ncbi:MULTISPECIES: hypothetical protein [Paenibacillus]|uniref:hypothetical protein n=1 Tax=Paenibacillus TaxID=44249 RepID=UPI0022B8EAE9|nr:hypothetical protein [Paenibacillus caseinilyticus]MCZ8524044.1 hypothetical protein [Paenibacillus caseinilyticus]